MNERTPANATSIFTRTLVVLIPLVLSAGLARATTLGLWEFEENPPGTSIAATGTQLLDTSGKGHDFTELGIFPGILSWNADVPPGATPGSASLGTGNFYDKVQTAATDDFSIGKTGDLQISLWYKPKSTGSYQYILEYDIAPGGNAANGWGLYQDFPTAGEFALVFDFKDDSAGGHILETASTYTDAAGWLLLELSFDTTAGTAEFKVNGSVEDTLTGLDSSTWGTLSAPLQIGGDQDGGFGSNGSLDTLQISVIPEPSIVHLGLIGVVTLIARQRRTRR